MTEKERKKLVILVHGGTIDRLYPAFILASAASAMDREVHMYFTFWGLQMLVKGALEKAELSATYKHLEEQLKNSLREMKYPSIYDMLKTAKASGLLKIYACSSTMKMFGIKKEDLIPEVDEIAGAATFLNLASKAEIALCI